MSMPGQDLAQGKPSESTGIPSCFPEFLSRFLPSQLLTRGTFSASLLANSSENLPRASIAFIGPIYTHTWIKRLQHTVRLRGHKVFGKRTRSYNYSR